MRSFSRNTICQIYSKYNISFSRLNESNKANPLLAIHTIKNLLTFYKKCIHIRKEIRLLDLPIPEFPFQIQHLLQLELLQTVGCSQLTNNLIIDSPVIVIALFFNLPNLRQHRFVSLFNLRFC